MQGVFCDSVNPKCNRMPNYVDSQYIYYLNLVLNGALVAWYVIKYVAEMYAMKSSQVTGGPVLIEPRFSQGHHMKPRNLINFL